MKENKIKEESTLKTVINIVKSYFIDAVIASFAIFFFGASIFVDAKEVLKAGIIISVIVRES